jgi:hypothetical protein
MCGRYPWSATGPGREYEAILAVARMGDGRLALARTMLAGAGSGE